MNAESIERIVVAELGFDNDNYEVAKDADDETHEDARHGSDESGSRCDGNQACNGTRNGSECGGFAFENPLNSCPGERGGGGSEVSADESTGGERSGRESRACIEAEPADPEQAGPDEAEHEGMRSHLLARVADALPQVKRAN